MRTEILSSRLDKPAYVYLRQSTMGQVRHHRESTERQYALKGKAQALGWSPDRIRILDGDLGLSGAESSRRLDFQTLVADVSMGRVGAVFALEASRLSRSNTDWHRLLELCALTGTLLIDEDGCYDPADFNDQLLLGLKGTMSQAELHFLRARLLGGKLNKAKKGELRRPLPVGYVYDEEGRIIVDSDAEVRGALQLVFQAFRETGTAYGVMRYFGTRGLKFPKRAYGGAWNGKLVWSNLSHSRVLGVLKNPAYAGAYVYGRYKYEKRLSAQGTIHSTTVRKSMDSWNVLIQEHHEGYLCWEEYLRTQQVLEKNQTNENVLPSAAREGLALLQGLLVCAKCGRRVTVRYTGNGGISPSYLCTRSKLDGQSTSHCITVRSAEIDEAISKRVLEALKPAQIEIAVRAYEELERRQGAIDRQWSLKIERAEYEAQLAQRRYEEVDPANRLVASTLEKRWNDSLEHIGQLKAEFADYRLKEQGEDILRHKEEVMTLGKDLPRLWKAATTSPKDRKRMLRLLIKDITLERHGSNAVLHVRWQGGATEDLVVRLPRPTADIWRHAPETIARVRDLATNLADDEIAATLNREGVKTNKGNVFTVHSVRWIRFKHSIPAPNLKGADELTVQEVARRFNVSSHVVYYWIERNIVKARKNNNGTPWWITVDQETVGKLQQWAEDSKRIAAARRSQTHVEGGAL